MVLLLPIGGDTRVDGDCLHHSGPTGNGHGHDPPVRIFQAPAVHKLERAFRPARDQTDMPLTRQSWNQNLRRSRKGNEIMLQCRSESSLMKLRNAERAAVDVDRLRNYCLSLEHRRGCHKARVFKSSLGITQDHAEILRKALLAAALNLNWSRSTGPGICRASMGHGRSQSCADRTLSAERIHYSDTTNSCTWREILRVDLIAAARLCGCNNGSIPD